MEFQFESIELTMDVLLMVPSLFLVILLASVGSLLGRALIRSASRNSDSQITCTPMIWVLRTQSGCCNLLWV